MKRNIFVLLGLAALSVRSVSAGGWQVVASPNGPRPVNELHGVFALSENDAWAVGVSYNTERTIGSTLIEHWNGAQWSVVPSPNPSSTINLLEAVAAVAANDVWAVGFAARTPNSILIMHWNGVAWSVTPNPVTSMSLTNLAALAVVSTNDIWAVGTGRVGDEDATVTIHWNGTAWSLIPSPNVAPEVDNTLTGATAVASNDVWAVGTQHPTSLTDPHTLILHWNGSGWRIVPSPNDGGSTVGNHLLAAAAVSAKDVWAVGYSEFGTLSEHWNGSKWSVVPTPDPPGGESLFLFSTAVQPNGVVWSVGEFFQDQQSGSGTLTERWNGSQWVIVTSPNSGPSQNELFGVAATPGGTLWAVGTAYNYPKQRTLVERKLP
jgi:hypothetical protein